MGDETSEEGSRGEAPRLGPPPNDLLWEALARRLTHITVEGATAHRLGPLTAQRWRSLGRSIPHVLLRQERAARIAERFAPAMLRRLAEASEQPMLVFKGPEIAARYPSGSRTFSDIDVLVQDAAAAQQALLTAGFVETVDPEGLYSEIHHLPPLRWPAFPLAVEIHSSLKWPRDIQAPNLEPIFEAAVPDAAASGLRAPAPHHHALILAAHSWAHTPLRSARDLIDVAVIANDADRAVVEATANEWGLLRIFHTMNSTAEWLVGNAARPPAVSLWARHLIELREATVLEGHLERWVSPFWAHPPRAAAPIAGEMLAIEFTTREGETIREKVSRVGRAIWHALMPKSRHGWGPDERPAPRKRSGNGR